MNDRRLADNNSVQLSPMPTLLLEQPKQSAMQLSTRLAFLAAGFGFSCWAPLVPYAKQRLSIDDSRLGLLLLCIGVGSVVAMLGTGPINVRYGSRPVILVSGILLACMLPLLATASTELALGMSLFMFGAALGSLDVAMNVHALEVERIAARPMMSGFHALFSIGGFAGAAMLTLLLTLKISALTGAIVCCCLLLATIMFAASGLLRTRAVAGGPVFAAPRGVVLLLALLAAVTFLIEGAMLDWGAIYLSESGILSKDKAGLGYVMFSIAMTTGRLAGDRLTAAIGGARILKIGSVVTVAGVAVLLCSSSATIAMLGFVLIGIGASNIVPVLFSRAGTQNVMPAPLAIAAVTTTGYAGVLLGPAAIGFVAEHSSMSSAFWLLAGLMSIVTFSAGIVMRPNDPAGHVNHD